MLLADPLSFRRAGANLMPLREVEDMQAASAQLCLEDEKKFDSFLLLLLVLLLVLLLLVIIIIIIIIIIICFYS